MTHHAQPVQHPGPVDNAQREGNQDSVKHVVPVRVYLNVLIALMALLVVTVVASFIDFDAWTARHHLGTGWSVAIALTIAVVKALLILLVFMHVKYSGRLVWAFAGASFLWLGIMFALSFSDYLARRSQPNFLGPVDQAGPAVERPPPARPALEK